MTKEEAKELLKCHAFAHEDTESEKMRIGFLGMLRPFGGGLDERNFHELMEIIEVLADELERGEVDREIMACLWGICQLARAWALVPGGMLQRNGLISAEQTETLEEWLDMLSYAVMILLEGEGGREEAFWGYRDYVKSRGM